MKKIYLSIVAAVSLMFVSCTADWLNTDPSTAVPSDDAIKNIDDAQVALNGIYRLASAHSYYGDNYLYYADCRGEDVQARINKGAGRRVSPYYFFDVTADDNFNITLVWNQPYKVIHQANSLIEKLDWSAGYSYANRNMPDRRRYTTVLNEETNQLEVENLNEINREFSRLDEHILSANINYQHDFSFGIFTPSLKVGAYTEHRAREYNTRFFIYSWKNGLPGAYKVMNVPNELLQEKNYGENGLYLLEQVDWRNNYEGNNLLSAGYVGGNLPLGKLNVYAGVRFEYNRMELVSHTQKNEESPTSVFYTYDDFFPSVNAAYRLNDKHQFRLSYGRTVNRPEFREVSSSVYYDFDLASNVQGNYNLKPAYIDNLDFGYEFYPSSGELISVSLFYNRFKNPIEWTYTVSGGTDLIYSYVNAKGADNYGVEVDIRKNLDFIGMRNFSLSLNGALIKSKVKFEPGAKEKDRPMQGQSPYLINAGFFYQHADSGWNAALLYNRIGKRIIGVGRSLGTADNEVRVPDSYEMPRNAVDLSVSKKIGNLEIKVAVRDLLAEKVSFKQFEETRHGKVEQITRQYKSGRNFNLNINYTF